MNVLLVKHNITITSPRSNSFINQCKLQLIVSIHCSVLRDFGVVG